MMCTYVVSKSVTIIRSKNCKITLSVVTNFHKVAQTLEASGDSPVF